jgi:acyl carrier protein
VGNEPLSTVIDGDAIKERLREFILTKMLPGEEAAHLTDTTPLVSGGVIDSINSMNVGVFIEKSFGVSVSPEELANPENLETIEAITSLVLSKLRH